MTPDPHDYATAEDYDGALWWHETAEDADRDEGAGEIHPNGLRLVY